MNLFREEVSTLPESKMLIEDSSASDIGPWKAVGDTIL